VLIENIAISRKFWNQEIAWVCFVTGTFEFRVRGDSPWEKFSEAGNNDLRDIYNSEPDAEGIRRNFVKTADDLGVDIQATFPGAEDENAHLIGIDYWFKELRPG